MTYTRELPGFYTEVIEDEQLAAAYESDIEPLTYRVLEAHWNADCTIRRIIRAEIVDEADTP